MTETTDTATNVENPAVADEGASVSVDTLPDDRQDGDDNREAAKYRHRAKIAEAERDQLAERLTVLRRAEVERLAAAHLADGADVWRDGVELESMLNDDGDIAADKVEATAKALLEAHKHWRRVAPAAPPASTVTSNGKITSDRPGNSFEDAFRPRSG